MALCLIGQANLALAQEPPATLRNALKCRSIATSAERLSCYDKAVASLGEAAARKEVVVLDQEEVRQTRRSLFGFSVPRLFGGATDAKDKPLDRLETVVASIGRDQDNRLTFTVEGGGRWRQIDDRPSTRVRPGTKVTLNRASLGSYFAAFPGLVSIRVRREG